MGVIQRQAIKNNFINYLAVGVGVIAQLALYPEDLALKGYFDAIMRWVFLLGPFMMLGIQTVIVRYLPYLEGDRGDNAQRLLWRALALVTGTWGLIAGLNWAFGEPFFEFLVERGWQVGLLATDRWTIIALLGGVNYAVVISTHLSNYERIALPALFNNLLVKLLLPAAFALTVYGVITETEFVYAFITIYWLAFIGLLFYSAHLKVLRPKWGKLQLKEKRVRDMVSLGGFSLFAAVGSTLAQNLDIVSVNTLIGNTETGIYSFAVFVMAVMNIPYRAINVIVAPRIAKAWQEKDSETLDSLYKQASSVLFLVGALIYSGALVCLPAVYDVTEKTGQYAVGYTAAVLLGVGQLVDQASSLNTALITFTDNYRWSVVFMFVLGLVNLVLNYYFIAVVGMGITGAALATMLSLVVYNGLGVALVHRRVGVQPVTSSLLWTTLVMLVVIAIGIYLPRSESAVIDLLARGVFVVACFYAYLRFTNGVPALREVVRGGPRNLFK